MLETRDATLTMSVKTIINETKKRDFDEPTPPRIQKVTFYST